MKVVCFVGSGFNYMLADIVKPLTNYTIGNVTLHEKLISLNKLWYQLEPLFTPFHGFLPTTNGEQILEALEGFQKVYNNFIGNRDEYICQNDIVASHVLRINKEMQKVGEQFTMFEKEKGYSLINRALPNFGSIFNELLIRNGISNFYLCTTNYDGIVESLLTYYCAYEQKRKFILKDGFIPERFNRRLFEEFEYKIAHLHGSYRYYDCLTDTIKLGKETINNRPVMIYDNPNRKEAAIMSNKVLSANFLELKRQLTTCDKVIIIGNSFKTEPHLKQAISNHFNRQNTQMIVCSDKPNEVVSILEPYYDFPIYTQPTTHVKSEQDLINLFKKLFDTGSYKMLATA